MTGFQGETACRRARHAGAIGLLWAIIVMVFVPAQSVAQIVSVTGQIEVVTIPPSLLGGVLLSQTHIRLMHEGTGFVTSGMPAFAYDGVYHNPSLPNVPGDSTSGMPSRYRTVAPDFPQLEQRCTASCCTLIRTCQVFLLILRRA